MTEDTMKITPRPIVVMGVSGTGKTTIAQALAERLGWDFQEGDNLHTVNNVEKMRSGFPLTDEDRIPWLRRCREWLRSEAEAGRGAILTCSALKKAYRQRLCCGLPIQFLYIRTSKQTIADRLAHRTGHYMPPSLLDSQFRTLEEPTADEPVIVIPGDGRTLDQIVEYALEKLRTVPVPKAA